LETLDQGKAKGIYRLIHLKDPLSGFLIADRLRFDQALSDTRLNIRGQGACASQVADSIQATVSQMPS